MPVATGLVGATFFQQAYVHDPGANLRGFTTTNAARCVVGSR
jgi:hypothetical protein